MSHWEIRIALVLTLFLAGIPQGSSAATPTVTDVIATMAVKGRAPKTGYTRALGDIQDSIAELAYYRSAVFVTGDEQ